MPSLGEKLQALFTELHGYEALSYLTDEEKRLGVKMLAVNYANVP